ncbi:hypothetical protein BIY29_06145 [Brenneria alni]|uniref:Glycosyl transferase family 1 n=1 Tax=Brenneria alni TaxID=71656 RepID=A0A421DR38_9GAMM|nr:glycosyltransferase [Brenneria alni]RLM26395.1 hypothetical protein BIY29_06145 [Brenneria alni]
MNKIAIYNLNSYPEMSGGSEISCLELAEKLVSAGEDVSIVALQNFKSGIKKIKYRNVNIFKLPLLNIYFPTDKKKKSFLKKVVWNLIDVCNIPMVLFLCFWLKKNGFDIVHTNNVKGASPWIFPFLRFFGFRVIHTTRDYYLLDSGSWYRDINENHNTLKNKIRRMNKLVCSKSINHVVFNSKFMMDYHLACGFFQKQKKSVIYNGFDNTKYIPETKCELENKIRIFGYIGRFSEEKGLDDLVRGFLKIRNENYKIVIAGVLKKEFLDKYPDLGNLIKDCDDVIFLGVVDSIEFYKKVDCVIVPSRYNEPFGRVAMESIFMGKAVIVSDKGGLPEQILPGVNGLICRNRDYAEAMKKIAKMPKTSLKTDLSCFSLENCASKYLAVYKGIDNGK